MVRSKKSDHLFHQEYFDTLASIDALPGIPPFRRQVPKMKVLKIHEGLWRWTASDPRFAPPEVAASEVGCIYYESLKTSPSATVLIDPLVPPEGTSEAERFWRALDRDVARVGRPVAVLLGTEHHARSAQRILDRYTPTVGASLYVRGAGDPLPSGVQVHAADALGETEAVYFIPEHRALFFADVLIGAGNGRARLTPRSWARPGEGEAEAAANRDDLRTFLTRLAKLPVEMLLFSHGEPVLERGAEALLGALSAPRWDRAFCSTWNPRGAVLADRHKTPGDRVR